MRSTVYAILTVAVVMLGTLTGEKVSSVLAAPMSITVSGNALVDGNGNTVVLHGVNRSGTEYACVQGWGIFDGPNVTNDDSQVPLYQQWGINEVNIGLNEDCWLNINGMTPAYSGSNYIAAIQHYVATLEAAGIYPVLSLFWNAPGTTKATGQSSMTDADHSADFWKSVANTFKNDPAVIFRLKEEPYPDGNGDTPKAWDCWSHGDVQYDASGNVSGNVAHCSEGYPVVGMQSLVNVIRATGATNVIQVPGVQYANTMTQFLNPSYRVIDSLSNLQGISDTYPNGNICNSVSCYNSQYAPVAAVMPFMVGEFGESVDGSDCSVTGVNALMNWADSHGSGYSAWSWDTWGGCLQLISSYSTGAPNGQWGTTYKSHVLSLTGTPTATPTSGPTNTPSPPTSTPTATTVPPTPTNTTVPSGNVNWSTGYYTGWENLPISQIPWDSITHLIEFSWMTQASAPFLNMSAHSVNPTQMNNLVAAGHAAGRKVLISIGGAEDQNWNTACNATNRATFVSNAIQGMKQYGFDGIDLDIEQDWQSPQHTDYIACVDAFRAAMPVGDLLTEAADPSWQAYMLQQVWTDLDQINLMSYGCCASNMPSEVANYTSRGIPESLLGVGIGIDSGSGGDNGANVSDCGAKTQYAAQNGMGVMEWTVAADVQQPPQPYPCFNQIRPYVPQSGTPVPTDTPGPTLTSTATPLTSATPTASQTPVATATKTPSPTPTPVKSKPLLLYGNGVASGWVDGSFSYSSRSAVDSSVFYSPIYSYAITLQAYGALAFRPSAGTLTPFGTLKYLLNPNGQPLSDFGVLMTNSTGVINEVALNSTYATASCDHAGWYLVSVPVSLLDPSGGAITSVQFKNETSGTLKKVHYDDVYLSP